MKTIKLLVTLTPFIITACGGGGSGASTGSDASANQTGNTTPAPMTRQQQVDATIADFSGELEAQQSATADASLSGIWMEVAGDIRTETGTSNGETVNGDYVDSIYRVHFVQDNGSSVDVSDCSTALTLYTFHYNDSRQLVWSNFKGATKPVGTISNNKVIDFGTTAYSYPRATANSDITYSGDYSSRWIKLSNNRQDSIGTLGGYGRTKQISCASIVTGEGTLNEDLAAPYTALFRDRDGDWLSTDNSSGNAAPTRSGARFDMTYDGADVRFNLN